MKRIKILVFLFLVSFFVISCSKDDSTDEFNLNATGTLKVSASGDCLPSAVQGMYNAGMSLTAVNYINVTVNFTDTGSYSIATNTVNGYSFSAAGTTNTFGIQTIKLTGVGTPVASGINNFTVTLGKSQCNIMVQVLPATTPNAVITAIDCSQSTPAGNYAQSIPTTTANTVQVKVTVSTAGNYDIRTDTVHNVSFSGAGFLTAGVHLITLTANGGTSPYFGTFPYRVSSGTATCSFSVFYTAAPPEYFWRFKVGNTVYSGRMFEAELEPGPIGDLDMDGDNSARHTFNMTLENRDGAISMGDYPGIAPGLPQTGKFVRHMWFEDGVIQYNYLSSNQGNISANITSINTTTHVVQGTFSGTARTATGVIVTVTDGAFKVHYP